MPPALSIVMPFRNAKDINFALWLGTLAALRQMRAHPIPPLYQSGIRYERDTCKVGARSIRGACEPFKTPLEVLRIRKADCDDLGIYRAAELIKRGDRKARALAVRSPGVGWHVVVRRGDGTIEDPSKRLGMKG